MEQVKIGDIVLFSMEKEDTPAIVVRVNENDILDLVIFTSNDSTYAKIFGNPYCAFSVVNVEYSKTFKPRTWRFNSGRT